MNNKELTTLNRNERNECYICQFRRNIPGDCHISCKHPDPEMTGNEHGIKEGWFAYPFNLDPTWKEKSCDNFYSSERPFAACILILNDEGKLLSTSRRGEPTAHGLVGGKLDDGESPLEAVIRETLEETDILLNAKDIVEIYNGLDDDDKVTTAFVYMWDGVTPEPKQMEDDIEVNWIEWEELFKGAFPKYNALIAAIMVRWAQQSMGQ